MEERFLYRVNQESFVAEASVFVKSSSKEVCCERIRCKATGSQTRSHCSYGVLNRLLTLEPNYTCLQDSHAGRFSAG